MHLKPYFIAVPLLYLLVIIIYLPVFLGLRFLIGIWIPQETMNSLDIMVLLIAPLCISAILGSFALKTNKNEITIKLWR